MADNNHTDDDDNGICDGAYTMIYPWTKDVVGVIKFVLKPMTLICFISINVKLNIKMFNWCNTLEDDNIAYLNQAMYFD